MGEVRIAKPKPREMDIVARKLRVILQEDRSDMSLEEKEACTQVASYFEQEYKRITSK